MGDEDTVVLTPEEKDKILSDVPEDEQQDDESEDSTERILALSERKVANRLRNQPQETESKDFEYRNLLKPK